MKMTLMMTILSLIHNVRSFKQEFLISTESKIWSIQQNGNRTLLYEDNLSKFISLALDLHEDSLIFWSDMGMVRKGIYVARFLRSEVGVEISRVEKIPLYPPINTVYCLVVDPVTNSLYWTDAIHQTIEVYSYTSKFRKIIIFEDLGSPRGITLDLYGGFLFWNDQHHNRIERSRLDGSERKEILGGAFMPNHMACHKGRLYWTNSKDKVLESVLMDGSDRRVERNFSRQVASSHIFGLAITSSSEDDDDDDDDENDREENPVDDNSEVRETFLVTGLSGSVFFGSIDDDDNDESNENVKVHNEYDFKTVSLENQKLFGAVTINSYKGWEALKNYTNPCSSLCQQLCFNIEEKARCSCASYGGVTPDGTQCVEPKDVLLFTIGQGGFVAYLPNPDWDASNMTSSDVYFVAKGVRPTAVAYNPHKRIVYWSDVDVQKILQTSFDGTETFVLLDVMKETGIVDGLVYDPSWNLLFFTNIGVTGDSYTWRKVEVIDPSDPGKRRTITTRGDMLRALAVDAVNNFIYYSDWGEIGSIMRSNMNGTDVKIIRSGLDNPNGLILKGDFIYFIDSHYKTKDKRAALYRMNLNGGDLVEINDVQLETPFGMTMDRNRDMIIISDWGLRQILTLKMSSSSSSPRFVTQTYLEGPEYIMGLHYTPVYTQSGPHATCPETCEGICLGSGRLCLNTSYNKDLNGFDNFIAVSDITGIKALNLGLDNQDIFPHPYSFLVAISINALAYHKPSRKFYFQDGYEKWIRVFSSGASLKFFQPNHEIRSMLASNDSILWFDHRGHLRSLELGPGSTFGNYSVVLKGRTNPRGLREHKGDLYWIEGSGHLQLFKIKIGNKVLPEVNTPEIVLPECTGGRITWTSIVYLYDAHLYLTEGLKNMAKLFRCSLDGEGSTIPELVTHLDNPQDLFISNGNLFYTNQVEGTLNLKTLDITENDSTQVIIDGLYRPFHIFVHNDQPTQDVCSPRDKREQCPSGSCTPIMGRVIRCKCPHGSIYDHDSKECIDLTDSDSTCDVNNVTLNFSDVITINECKSCQCFGRGRIMGEEPEMVGVVCRTTQCSLASCEGKETKVQGQCCPVCGAPCVSPQFSDCPKKPLVYTLPKDQNYVIDLFQPRPIDCPGIFRNVNVTRSPTSNIIQWQEGNVGQTNRVKFVATAFDSDGNLLKTECSYSVHLIDVTPPTIICPNDVKIFTLGSEVQNVRWPAPTTSDNSNEYVLTFSHEQGSSFPLGRHRVTYAVTDSSNRGRECSFNVLVERNKETVSCEVKNVCPVKQVLNGHLVCSCVSGQLNCHVTCDSGYVVSDSSSTNFTCDSDVVWSHSEILNVESTTCVRKVPRTLVLTTKMSLEDKCLRGPDLKFTLMSGEQQYKTILDSLSGDPQMEGAIQVEDCVGGDLKLDFQLKRKAEEEEVSNLKPIMERLMESVIKYIDEDSMTLEVLSSNSSELERAYNYKLEQQKFKFMCGLGEIPFESFCIKCPPGTFWNSTLNDPPQCSPCPDMTFNLQEGRDRCTSCGREYIGHVGDVQCLVSAEATSARVKDRQRLVTGVLCIVVVLVILVVVVVFSVRHCRRTGKYSVRREQIQESAGTCEFEQADLGGSTQRHLAAKTNNSLHNDKILFNGSKNYQRFDLEFESKSQPLIRDSI